MSKKIAALFTYSLPLLILLSGGAICLADSFSQVSDGYKFEFPRSHGSHPSYATEWWYFTGHAKTKTKRTFGFELTFFRVGVNPSNISASAWSVNSLFLAHFALTDDSGKRFYHAQRLGRDSFAKASASKETLNVKLDDWRAHLDSTGKLAIIAQDKDFGISFNLRPKKPPVLHGEKGISRKGDGANDASYYSSFTRLLGNGQIRIGENELRVPEVQAWMDHEVTSSRLARGVEGWDWFAVQLESGEDIMLYQLRMPDGGVSDYSSGSIVDINGEVEHLNNSDFSVEVHDYWTSPKTAIRYPSRWTLRIPKKDISMTITPTLPEQEMLTKRSAGISYWEGRCLVSGTQYDNKLSGNAYVELVGYKK